MNPNADPQKALQTARLLVMLMLANGGKRKLHRDADPPFATYHLHTPTHCILLTISPLDDQPAR